jgi:hypothetical protein
MSKTSKLSAVVGVGMLAAAFATAHDAGAQSCGMGNIDWYANDKANVARAETLLAEGKPQDAAWLIQQTWPRMSEAVPVSGSLPHIAEGVRIMALAAVRTDGAVTTGLGWASRTPLERSVNVTWGVRRLRMLTAAYPTSNEAKTDLGEALARAPATQDEARGILEALAKTDGISSPEGYAALARVRTAAGDSNGAAVASAECTRRTSVASRCAVPAASTSASAVVASR